MPDTNKENTFPAIEPAIQRVPKGHHKVSVYEVFTNGCQLVILGEPPDGDDECQHNCDEMGCGTFDHVLFRINLNDRQMEIAKEYLHPKPIVVELPEERPDDFTTETVLL